jgi:hypothetical protein
MNHYTATQLAEIRRQDLTAEATYQRQARTHRTRTSSQRRRPFTAFHAWVAAFHAWAAASQL